MNKITTINNVYGSIRVKELNGDYFSVIQDNVVVFLHKSEMITILGIEEPKKDEPLKKEHTESYQLKRIADNIGKSAGIDWGSHRAQYAVVGATVIINETDCGSIKHTDDGTWINLNHSGIGFPEWSEVLSINVT